MQERDGGDAGNVIEIEEALKETLTLERGPTAECVIPKSKAEGYNGSEVSLNVTLNELNKQYSKK